jgi:5-bromo-4-chloroindolyl phosphate hydrolysis protein
MQVGDEFFLSVLYPLTNYKDFAVTYDDWDYVKEQLKNIRSKINILKKSNNINKNEKIDQLWKQYDNIGKNPKTIINVSEDIDKIKHCKSYFYRKFDKSSNIEKYWKVLVLKKWYN